MKHRGMSTNVVDALAKVPLLAGLDKKHLEKLAKDFSERTFPAGTAVVKEGEGRGIGFFIVADGEGVATVGGREVGQLGPGSYFGEVALISDRVRTATVTATTDLHCYVMTLWDFRSFVKGDAEIAWKLLEHLAELLHAQAAPGHG
jgi:voltage-gated potassium channel